MPVPLTQMQRQLWAVQRLFPFDPLYNTAWRFEIGTVDPERFERAIDVLAKSCDALRLLFDTHGDEPHARVQSGLAGRHRTLHMTRAFALADMEAAVRKPFDLGKSTIDSALYVLPAGGAIWFLNMHHIVNDGASGLVLFSRLADAYRALSLDPLPSFAGYMAEFDTRIRDVDQSFWRAWQRKAPGLPRLYNRALSGTSSVACERRATLTKDQMERLTARAASKGFASLSRDQTIFTLFETVLAAWVHRVAATDELAVGVATHGRQTPAERAMAGCFVDLFPVDVALDPWETFTSLYAKLRTRNMEVLRHARPGAFEARGDAPFSVVVNHVPLRFAQFEGAEPSAMWLGNGHVDPVHAVRLNLLDPGPDGALTLKVLFNAEVVPEAEADAALGHLMKLLDVVLDAPETAIGSVALAAESDASQQLLTAPLDADEIPDILAAFDAHCRADPSADLVSEGSKVWSRQDVRDRASAVAELLVHEGIGPNARIGIHLPRSVDLIAALVGVLKVGAAFVPLDPTQPDGRLDAIAEEARLSCLITTGSIDRNWPTPIPSIRMEDVPERASQQPSELASGPAYVLFTSGSTGRPKGVQVGRAALSRYAHWAADTHAGSAATWALHSAIGFDLTLTSIFAPLASGGSIRIYREAQTGPDLAVLAVFEEDAVDIVKLTPRHLTLALEAGSQVTRIRSLVLGGEELTTALAKRTLKQAGAHIAIHNEYGPTEAVVGCMDHVFDPTRDTDATVPIGHAASATRITVRDPALNPVPDGVIGALYVSGIDRLADGYLGRRTETAARFVTDPTTGERMYDTGDLASVRADGVILYHGRGDDQLKRAGLRIERGELVHAALTADGVSDCAVVMYDPEAQAARQCTCCGITDRVPDIRISEAGLCELCSDFDRYRARAASYFGSISDIHPKIADARARKTGKYDCVILLSGGKDSTYAVAKMAEITQNMLCVTLDNGFIAEEAKTNIRRITAQLGLDHRFLTTPAMADIFVDSLKRHSNVCQGCFKTIYTMALQVAREVGAPMIVTGLSRGQLFETRLAPELFKDDHSDPSRIDGIVLEARRTYHAFPDAVTKRLNGDLFDTGDILSEVEFLDFYRYCDVPVSEVYRYLDQRVGWVRPSDSGRSTNCLINDLGIYVHKAERRHHNYALPYSWDVRMGHKTKEECLDELDDEIDMDRISAIMEEIGYDGPEVPETGFLTCYYVGSAKPEAVRAAMARHVPRAAIPPHIVPVSKIPLNANGKVDTSALPSPIKGSSKVFAAPRVAGEGRTAQLLAIWQDVLKLPDLAPGDNFYDIGGSSIAAIQISTRAQADGINISPIDIFRQQSIAALVAGLGEAPKAAIKKPSAAPRVEVSAADKAKLAALLGQAGRG